LAPLQKLFSLFVVLSFWKQLVIEVPDVEVEDEETLVVRIVFGVSG
jgi:hypothetical protein